MALTLVGCKLDNPPITQEIHWDSERTEELARRACYDCHSNETKWPWTSYVPIVGSIVASDVHNARCHMNFSAWDRGNEDAWDAADEIRDGEMPLGAYTMMHKAARLSDAELEELAQGFERTLALDPPRSGEPCEDDEREDREDREDRDDRHAAPVGADRLPPGARPPSRDVAQLWRVTVAAFAASQQPSRARAELTLGGEQRALWVQSGTDCPLRLVGADRELTLSACEPSDGGFTALAAWRQGEEQGEQRVRGHRDDGRLVVYGLDAGAVDIDLLVWPGDTP